MSTAGVRVAREAALVVGLVTFFVLGTLAAQRHQVPPGVPLDAVGYLLIATSVLVLPGRHRWPWPVLATALAAIATYLALGYAYGPVFLAASVAIYAVAGRASLRDCAGAVLLGTAVLVGSELPRTAVTGAWDELLPLAGTFATWLIIPAWWSTARERLRQTRLTVAERHRREHGEQRLALAREVHDVVAHNLAVIGIQAGAGLRVFDHDPEQARAALRTIHHTNRQALAELRATVDLLRGDGIPTAPTESQGTPAPGLPGLEDLLAAARATGVDARLEVSGVPVIVTPLVERTAYRIVQEALTNALRHAPGASAIVALDYTPAQLVVRIVDDGPGGNGHPEGRGILGMRERACSAGGTLTTGQSPRGGFTVRAALPLAGFLA